MSRQEINTILNEGLQAAIRLLEKNSEFYPFAVVTDATGELCHVAGYMGDEHPLSDDVTAFLHKALAQAVVEGTYRATGIVSNVTLTDPVSGKKRDAISVAIEHCDAAPVTCFLPYELSEGRFLGSDIIAQAGESVVFGKGGG